jgi:transposase
VGRESGQIHLEVCHNSTQAELIPLVVEATIAGSVVNTDEWGAYAALPTVGKRGHATVCHKPGAREWARDDDNDGIRCPLQHNGRHLDRFAQLSQTVPWCP